MYAKNDIIAALLTNYEDFAAQVRNTPKAKFDYSHNGKWSVGQNLDHLIRAVKPLNLAFALPKLALRLLFGQPRTPNSRSYDEIIALYQAKLAKGAVASGRFVPPTIKPNDKDKLLQTYIKQHDLLEKKLQKYADEDLDKYRLPHPILGKLTLREMLFFTIYHTQHHTQTLKNYPKP